MGIRFACPNGHKLNVKDDLAGRRGICPNCGAKFVIPVRGSAARPPASPQPVASSLRDSEKSASDSRSHAPPVAPKSPPSPSSSDPLDASPASPGRPRGTAPPVAEPAVPLPPADAPPTAPVTLATDEPAPALTDDPSKTSHVARYLAQRRRSRQNQVILAILLLVSVVVLAIILVWVVQRGPETRAERPLERPPIVQAGADRFLQFDDRSRTQSAWSKEGRSD